MEVTMGRIRARIEVLEKAASARRMVCREIVNRALESLSYESVELLICAFEAERVAGFQSAAEFVAFCPGAAGAER